MTWQRSLIFACVALGAVTGLALMRQGAKDPGPNVVPFKSSSIYGLNEPVGWTISAPDNAPADYDFVLKENMATPIALGTVHAGETPAVIKTTISTPMMLYLQVKVHGGNQTFNYGAAVEPTKLKPVLPKPADFDTFWKGKVASLERTPMNPVLTPGESGRPDVLYSTLKMDHVDGGHVYGAFAQPAKPGKYPAILVLQWASPPYPLQKAWSVDLAAKGFIVLNLEPHDVLPTAAPEYYAGLPNELKHYERTGWQDRETSYFVDMYLRDYRGADYLTQRPDWDGKTLVVTGGSMGGQQSLCVAGLHPKITHLIVEEPAGCDLHAGLFNRSEGYPFFPVNDPKVMETAGYVDAVNFASRIRATCLVAMGFVDTIAPPAGIWTAFNQIRGPKEVVPLTTAPHNNIATYQQQLPYYQRYGAWLDALAAGRKVDVRR